MLTERRAGLPPWTALCPSIALLDASLQAGHLLAADAGTMTMNSSARSARRCRSPKLRPHHARQLRWYTGRRRHGRAVSFTSLKRVDVDLDDC